jgi:Tat protein secretion system quality control protein TatD with DNase activity
LSTVELLAEVRGVSVEQLARETTENARYLFRLPED